MNYLADFLQATRCHAGMGRVVLKTMLSVPKGRFESHGEDWSFLRKESVLDFIMEVNGMIICYANCSSPSQ